MIYSISEIAGILLALNAKGKDFSYGCGYDSMLYLKKESVLEVTRRKFRARNGETERTSEAVGVEKFTKSIHSAGINFLIIIAPSHLILESASDFT